MKQFRLLIALFAMALVIVACANADEATEEVVPTDIETVVETPAGAEAEATEEMEATEEAMDDMDDEDMEATEEAMDDMDDEAMEATEEAMDDMDDDEAMDDMGDDEMAAAMMMSECPVPSNLSGTVTVGAIFGLSGDISVYGGVQQQGVDLAVSEINDMGYLGEGVTLEIAYEDAVSAEDAVNAMTSLVEETGVVAVLGPTLSTQAFAADPVAQDNGVPVMGVSNTASGITDMGDFVFRNSLPESSVVPGTVAGAIEALGIETVGVLYGDDDDFTLSGYEIFIQALDDNGIEILGEETFARGDVDFNAQLTNLLASEPDALIVSALAAEGVQIIVQSRDLGYEGAIIGGNGLNSPAIIENAGDSAEGVIVGAAWNSVSDNPLSQAFVAHFTDAYGSAPDQFATQAYTGAWLMATAIHCADSTDSAAIRDALAGIENFDTPLGAFSFGDDRNPIHDPVVQVVSDGAFAVLGADMDMMEEDMDDMGDDEDMDDMEATEEAMDDMDDDSSEEDADGEDGDDNAEESDSEGEDGEEDSED